MERVLVEVMPDFIYSIKRLIGNDDRILYVEHDLLITGKLTSSEKSKYKSYLVYYIKQFPKNSHNLIKKHLSSFEVMSFLNNRNISYSDFLGSPDVMLFSYQYKHTDKQLDVFDELFKKHEYMAKITKHTEKLIEN